MLDHLYNRPLSSLSHILTAHPLSDAHTLGSSLLHYNFNIKNVKCTGNLHEKKSPNLYNPTSTMILHLVCKQNLLIDS